MAGLEWIADGEVLDEAVHSSRIRGGTCWVAADEHDTPVGFLSAEVIAEHDLHIYEMSVAASFQGHGAGRALLTAAIEWAVTHHLSAVTLTTYRQVPWNAPFYSRVGFKVLSASHLDTRLAVLLRKEVESGFAENTRCAMRLPLNDQASPPTVRKS
ncbi:GNAT family N-acetyltransferase [Acidisphaera sp. S103]|uniref:GNAT family N-acetyltransferase n=1 Tax=Acidisphaera sp. S103 TaxID=1747223 RepID=UPI0020B1473F|nr:GNAT family N-acetyltransferase [Acidisphaera sp. S103]